MNKGIYIERKHCDVCRHDQRFCPFRHDSTAMLKYPAAMCPQEQIILAWDQIDQLTDELKDERSKTQAWKDSYDRVVKELEEYRKIKCIRCKGVGMVDTSNYSRGTCPKCSGTGRR